MIELSNLTAQVLQPGQAVTFDKVRTKSGCGECFNEQIPTSVKLCGKGMYDIHFSGNITGAAAAALQMAIAVANQPLVETAMNSVPAADGDLNNIHTMTILRNCCCDLDRISVINSGAVALTLAPNSAFVITRRS